jgi:hypothetical protein
MEGSCIVPTVIKVQPLLDVVVDQQWEAIAFSISIFEIFESTKQLKQGLQTRSHLTYFTNGEAIALILSVSQPTSGAIALHLLHSKGHDRLFAISACCFFVAKTSCFSASKWVEVVHLILRTNYRSLPFSCIS